MSHLDIIAAELPHAVNGFQMLNRAKVQIVRALITAGYDIQVDELAIINEFLAGEGKWAILHGIEGEEALDEVDPEVWRHDAKLLMNKLDGVKK